jgi:hypothetical protein
MNARGKLNIANINGAILVSGVAGWWAGSSTVFVLVLIVLLATEVCAGNIR